MHAQIRACCQSSKLSMRLCGAAVQGDQPSPQLTPPRQQAAQHPAAALKGTDVADLLAGFQSTEKKTPRPSLGAAAMPTPASGSQAKAPTDALTDGSNQLLQVLCVLCCVVRWLPVLRTPPRHFGTARFCQLSGAFLSAPRPF
jgi:hypothetical protein